MSEIYNWGTLLTDPGQNAPVPDGAPENWLGKNVNNWGREFMAAVRRWYDDPEWIDPIWFLVGADPTYIRDSATQFTLNTVDATSYFLVGRRIKIIGDTTTYATIITATFGTNTVVTVSSGSVPVAPTRVLVHVLAGEFDGATFEGRFMFGGFGTQTARSAAFGTAPTDGILWFNTSTGQLEIGASSGWRSILKSDLGFHIADSTIDGAGFDVYASGKLAARFTRVDPDAYIDVYDDADGTTLLASYKFGADGTTEVDDQGGGGFVPFVPDTSTKAAYSVNTNTSGSEWERFAAPLRTIALAGADGAKRFRVETDVWVVGTNNIDTVALTVDRGASKMLAAITAGDDAGASVGEPADHWWPDDSTTGTHFHLSTIVTPNSGDTITLWHFTTVGISAVAAGSHVTITPLLT